MNMLSTGERDEKNRIVSFLLPIIGYSDIVLEELGKVEPRIIRCLNSYKLRFQTM